MSADQVIVVRHGQTDWNKEQRWQGRTDIPLNELGVRQAQTMASQLTPLYATVSGVFSSNLKRARSTAEAVFAAASVCAPDLGCLVEMSDFAEFASGRFEGLTRTQIEEQHAENLAQVESGQDVPIGEVGERPSQVQQRLVRGVDTAVASVAGGTVIVVGHGGAWRIFANHVLGLPAADRRLGLLRNGHWARFTVSGVSQYELTAWNEGGLAPVEG